MPPRIQGVSLERFQREPSTAPWVSPFVFCKTIPQKTVFWGMSFNRGGVVRKKRGVLPVGFVEWQGIIAVRLQPCQNLLFGSIIDRAIMVADQRETGDGQRGEEAWHETI